MELKYGLDIELQAIKSTITRLTNQIYKLLPIREEGLDWKKPLSTIMEEIAGMDRLFYNQQSDLYKLSCKLEGLFTLENEENFMLYRGIIFECLSILGELQKCL